MIYRHLESPVGRLMVAGEDRETVSLIGFPEGKARIEPAADWEKDDGAFGELARQLGEYFGGTRRSFDVKLAAQGTPFQLAVLEELRRIPYGETRSYGDIAERLGKPKAVRAVGAANGRNPLPIVIPCHRVVGANGDLTGFGGGIETKRFLLSLEQSGARTR